MKTPLLLLATAACALTGGCAFQPHHDPAVAAAARAPLLCEPKEQCKLYWQRAQAWLAQNNPTEITVVTDFLMDTRMVGGTIPTMTYRITRVPSDTPGMDRIVINGRCPNPFGCGITLDEAAAKFKRFVSAAQ